MRTIPVCCMCLVLACAATARAQQPEWEVGGAVGFGSMQNATVSNLSGSAGVGFDNRFAAGAVLGQDLYQHFGGELRYMFRDNDLVLKSAGQKVNMDGDSHLIHYDALFHALSKESRIRPYVAGGAGIRFFRATGKEYPSQPLSDFAFLTKTDEVKPLISAGGGVKFRVSEHAVIRADFREYFSPFPEKLFAVTPGTKIRGWLYDAVPFVGVSWMF